MAKLLTKGLTLEIRFLELGDSDWVDYEILFLHKDQPIINDSILSFGSQYRPDHTPGAFTVNEEVDEFAMGGLVDVFRKAMDADRALYYEPLEPDMCLSVYPGWGYPKADYYHNFVAHYQDGNQPVSDPERVKTDKSPDDLFTIIVLIDTHNFIGTAGYSCTGPTLIFNTRRRDLELFVDELESEFNTYCETWHLFDEDED